MRTMRTRNLRAGLLMLAAAAATALPVRAGVYFEQHVTSTGQGSGLEMNVKGWAEGDNAKILYEESNNPVMESGSYLLTTDGGKTVYLIRPAEQTYSKWDMEEAFAALGRMSEMSGGMVHLDFKDPHGKTLLSEPGGTVLGYSTTHYKWESGYTVEMKVAFMDMTNKVDTVTDAWVTKDVNDPGLFTWLRATLPSTGDPEFDQIIRQNADVVGDGIVLKMDQATTTTNKKGKQQSSTTRFVVTKLVQQNIDDSIFAMPSGYTETPLIAAAAGAEGEQQNEAPSQEKSEGPMKSLKGLFGKKK